MVASVIPIDILAQERKFIYARSGDLGRVEAAVQTSAPYYGLMTAEVGRHPAEVAERQDASTTVDGE